MNTGPTPSRSALRGVIGDTATAVVRWFDAYAGPEEDHDPGDEGIDWLRVLPFVVLHAGCLLVLVTGVSWTAVVVAAALYAIRMFAITAFYHRYFSHRAFRTSRVFQFLFAVLGGSSAQRGALWWAAHHRHHHRHSDESPDFHSPARRGLFWSHMGWLMTRGAFRTRSEEVRDLTRFPELVFLDRFDILVPLLLAGGLYGAGEALAAFAPGLGTDGLQLLAWGFFVSTVVLFHATCTINSLAHRIGTRRFATTDDSRNNLWLALLTFGEGWHNNHHRFPGVARQGLRWWEIDLTYYGLVLLSKLGVVHDLRPAPDRAAIARALEESR